MICTKTFRILILYTVMGTFPDLDTCRPCSFPHTGVALLALGASMAQAACGWPASTASAASAASAASTAASQTCRMCLALPLAHFLLKVVQHPLRSFSAKYAEHQTRL